MFGPPNPIDEDTADEYAIKHARFVAAQNLESLCSMAKNQAALPRAFFVGRRMAIALIAQEYMNVKSSALPFVPEEIYLQDLVSAIKKEVEEFEIMEAKEMLERGAPVN